MRQVAPLANGSLMLVWWASTDAGRTNPANGATSRSRTARVHAARSRAAARGHGVAVQGRGVDMRLPPRPLRIILRTAPAKRHVCDSLDPRGTGSAAFGGCGPLQPSVRAQTSPSRRAMQEAGRLGVRVRVWGRGRIGGEVPVLRERSPA